MKPAKQDAKTDPNVVAYRDAATRYCVKSGLDPEAKLTTPHPSLAGVQVVLPMWYAHAERMYDLVLMMSCISEQRAAQKKAAEEAAAAVARAAEQKP